MKYEILRPQNDASQGETVFVIPVSSQADQHTVLYPKGLERRLSPRGAVEIRHFAGCSLETQEWVEDSLETMFEEAKRKERRRSQNVFVASIGLAVLAAVSWAFPDPLPILDEMVLTLGAGVLAFLSCRRYRDALRRKAVLPDAAETGRLERREDPVLTRLFNALQGVGRTNWDEAVHGDSRDLVELESEWLVRVLDVDEMVHSGEIDERDLRRTVSALARALPLKTLLFLEGRARHTRRLKRLRESLRRRYKLSENALIVYSELYRCTREFFRKKGLPFD